MRYRVTAGFVTVETTVGVGRAQIDIGRGEQLPADVPVEQVDRLLAGGQIEPDPDTGDLVVEDADQDVDEDPPGVPAGTLAEVLDWVGDNRDRAAQALAAEQAKGDAARSTLVAKLGALVEQP